MQTKLGSLVEALSNTAVGFLISMGINAVVMPAFGHPLSWSQNFWITCVFTVASIARGYVLRRAFTRIKRMHA